MNVASAVLSCWGVVEHHHVGCACHDAAVASPLLGDDMGDDEEAPRVEARRSLCAGGCCVAGGASPLAPPALFSLDDGRARAGVRAVQALRAGEAAPPPPAPDVVQPTWWWRRLDVGRLALVTHHAGDAAMCPSRARRSGAAAPRPRVFIRWRRGLAPVVPGSAPEPRASCATAAAAPAGKRAAWTLLEGAPADGDA